MKKMVEMKGHFYVVDSTNTESPEETRLHELLIRVWDFKFC